MGAFIWFGLLLYLLPLAAVAAKLVFALHARMRSARARADSAARRPPWPRVFGHPRGGFGHPHGAHGPRGAHT